MRRKKSDGSATPTQASEPESGPPTSPASGAVAAPVKEASGGADWIAGRPVVVGRPTPEFEPRASDVAVHRQFPYRADTVVDGWSTSRYAVRAASLRGHLHRYNGAPRQDDFAIALGPRDGQLIVAVADGVSAADQSHIGSTTAVRYAVQWLSTSLADPVVETDWNKLAGSVAWSLIQQASALLEIDQASAEQAEGLMATTLVCAVVDPQTDGDLLVHVVSIGDSGAWILRDGDFVKIDGGKSASSDGIASSAVSGLPRVPTELTPTSVSFGPGDVLLIGTDGFGDPLGGGSGAVGDHFREMLGDGPPPQLKFAQGLDFSRETFDDDRTLVTVWPVPATSDE